MFQKLVSRNGDIRRLVERGYAVAFDSHYLVIRDIPYLDSAGELRTGAIVTKLEFVDHERVTQSDHQIFFAGAAPHGLDSNPIANLGGGVTQLALSAACNDVVVERCFSNKPRTTGAFADFFEKIESYVAIISGPAMTRHPSATPYTFRAVADDIPSTSVFKFHDTLTSMAEIGDVAARLADDVVAIVGLGGTGAYLLDFLIKAPVREIRAFDGDTFHVHNAFRSPGRVEDTELGRRKAEVYQARYENFRSGLSAVPKFMDAESAGDLADVTFAFVCVDKGSSRSAIFECLLARKIPFIDVGMGLMRRDTAITGMLRATYFSAENGQEIRDKGLADMQDRPDDLYRTNIQIAELNALNACLAVIRFKQLRGFYTARIPSYHLLFDVDDLMIVSEANED